MMGNVAPGNDNYNAQQDVVSTGVSLAIINDL
jgi:hypothetical protein